MALNIDLQRIANSSSGVYFLNYDKSQVAQVSTSTGLRLLIGQSRRGPVNKPILCADGNFSQYFGTNDRSLERNGSFFHRSAEIMSQAGAFLMLNLRAFDDSLDLVTRARLSTSKLVAQPSNDTKPYTSVYNTQGAWFIDPSLLINESDSELISIVNLSEITKSVFVVKSKETGLDQTVASYYAQLGRDIPTYLDPTDWISDYMVDVYVFNNDFSNAGTNVGNAAYGSLFNNNGSIKKTVIDSLGDTKFALDQLSLISASGFVKKYTGSLIPDLTTISGGVMYIGSLVNADIDTNGILMDINRKILFDAGDWVPGSNYVSGAKKKPKPIDLVGHNLVTTNASSIITTDGSAYAYLSYSKDPVDYALNQNDLTTVTANDILTISNAWLPATLSISGNNYTYTASALNQFYIYSLSQVQAGDFVAGVTGNLTRIRSVEYVGQVVELVDIHTAAMPLQASGAIFPKISNVYVYPVGHANAGAPVEYSSSGVPLDAPGGAAIARPTLNSGQITSLKSTNGTTLNLFKVTTNEPIVSSTAVTSVTSTGATADFTKTLVSSATVTVVYTSTTIVKIVKAVDVQATEYVSKTLNGYAPRAAQFVNGTAARQNAILTATLLNSLRGFLTDLDAIDFSYLVDGFRTYVESNTKQQLTAIVNERQLSTAIINSPFYKDFALSTDPYFKETTVSQFNTRFIPLGGNTSLPYTKLYSLPSIGAQSGCMYFPNAVLDDNGTELIFPIAPIVSNNFAVKRATSNVFEAVFGAQLGRLAVNGMKRLEFALTKTDRDNLESFGMNPIIFLKNLGFVIFGNNTLYNSASSAFNFVNVRELVNYLQEQMKPIMESQLGRLNTQQNRAIILSQMNDVTRELQNSGGLTFYENICDETNNTAETIAEGLFIADTVIVPAYASTRIVYRTTTYRDTNSITFTAL